MDIMKSDAYAIAKYIKEAEKQTPVKAYINGDFSQMTLPEGVKSFGCDSSKTLIGDAKIIAQFVETYQTQITEYHLEWDRRNSAIHYSTPAFSMLVSSLAPPFEIMC